MNRHDREFLDRQMRRLPTSPRPVGVVMLILPGALLAGVVAGTMISTSQRPVETASSDGRKALALLLNGGRTIPGEHAKSASSDGRPLAALLSG
jgi:hypothetical protein